MRDTVVVTITFQLDTRNPTKLKRLTLRLHVFELWTLVINDHLVAAL